MARDHIVPQMLLRRFANARGHLRATPRVVGAPTLMSVARACREAGFYDIDFDPAFAHLVPRDQIERSLSDFEGRASRLFDRFANDELNLSDQDRFDLMLFVAFQAVRGWAFRDELSEIATLRMKQELEPILTTEKLRADLKREDRPHDDHAISAWRTELLISDWRLVPPPSLVVQGMADLALNRLHPDFYFRRRVRLLRFAEPVLLLSDEPVAMWARPDRDHDANPLGLATADAIYMPVDRRHVLALLLRGAEGVFDGGPKRAELVNRLVATGAHRWVFQHPDDPPYDVTNLGQRPRWTVETLGAVVEPDKVRVQKRLVREPPN